MIRKAADIRIGFASKDITSVNETWFKAILFFSILIVEGLISISWNKYYKSFTWPMNSAAILEV